MIGFVILSHRSSRQLLRLCASLSELYDRPVIAVHHDFRQSPLDNELFPPNVHFVEPSIPTGWAKWSLVEATLSALELLYRVADPEYFYILSASDYPLVRGEKAIMDLQARSVDAFIDAFPLVEALKGSPLLGDKHLVHHRAPHNLRLEWERYLAAQLKIPVVRFRPPAHSTTKERYPRIGRRTISLPFKDPTSPFDSNYQCFVGSQWFTGKRSVAHRLLRPSEHDLRLRHYYRNRVVPDESYFQCVICNAEELAYQSKTFRIAIWDGAHPIDLDDCHLDDIFASGAHFARKFSEQSSVLDLIDEKLGIGDK